MPTPRRRGLTDSLRRHALALHAEATLERVGPEREGIVREIFRNLTTAQGTRAVLDREELLSALPDRAVSERVLQQLVDARLLTFYEMEGGEGEPSHDRVEIVHESLLKAWPRLVRWQTQDADGAQLRDQLRQAAHLWEERGNADGLLWTGHSYLDYRVWRLPTFYALNFALEAVFKAFGRGSLWLAGGPIELGVKGEIFNLTNQQQVVNTGNIVLAPGSTYGLPNSRVALQSPRSLRFTGLVRF